MQHIDPLSLGHLIGRLQAEQDAARAKLTDFEPRLIEVEQKLGTLTTWATRGALLIALWAGAIGVNLAPEQKAELISAVLQRLAK